MKKLTAMLAALLIAVTGAAAITSVSAESAPSAHISSFNLSLEDNVHVYFRAYYEGIDLNSDEYGMIFWKEARADGAYTYENAAKDDKAEIRGKTEAWSYDSVISKNVATYTYKFAAKEMADVIYAESYCVKDGAYYYSDTVPYGVTTYAARKLGKVQGVAGTTDQNLKNVIKEMLEYGAAAQLYFGYNTDNLATSVLDLPDIPQYINPTFVVDTVPAAAGEENVAVKISVKNNSGISSISLNVTFDKTALTLTNYTINTAEIGGQGTPFNANAKEVQIPWVNWTTNVEGDWTFVTLYFTVSATATGKQAINVTYNADDVYDVNENNVAFDIVNGGIEIR